MIFKKVIKGGMCVQAGLRNANYYNTNEKGCESKDFFFFHFILLSFENKNTFPHSWLSV